jgi:hypothetical protein
MAQLALVWSQVTDGSGVGAGVGVVAGLAGSELGAGGDGSGELGVVAIGVDDIVQAPRPIEKMLTAKILWKPRG